MKELEELPPEVFEAFPFLLGKMGRGRIVALVEVRVNYVRIVAWLLQLWLHEDPGPRLRFLRKCSNGLLGFFGGALQDGTRRLLEDSTYTVVR